MNPFATFRVASRKVQTPPPLNVFPPTVVIQSGMPGFVGHFERTRNNSNRVLVKLPPLEVYPERSYPSDIPVGYSSSPFATRQVASRKLQAPPRLNVYTERSFSADIPVAPPLARIRKARSKKLQRIADLPSAPTTATTPAEYAAIVPPVSFKASFKRILRRLDTTATLTAERQLTSHMTARGDKPFLTRILRSRRIQHIPPLNVYPDPVVVPPQTISAIFSTKAIYRKRHPREITLTTVIISTKSFAPYPSYMARGVTYRPGAIKRVETPLLSSFLTTPAVVEQSPSAYEAKNTTRSKVTVKHQTAPVLSFYEPTPPPPEPTIAALVRAPQVARVGRKVRRLEPSIAELSPISLGVVCPVYFEGAMSDGVYVSSVFRTAPRYLQGEMTDIVYLQGIATGEVYLRTAFFTNSIYLQGEAC